jgi:hypothetical protein
MKAEGVKVEILNAIDKAKRNPASKALAMKGRCWQCEGIEDPGTVERIAACSVKRCALNPLRPHQRGGTKATIEKLLATAPTYPAGAILGPLERARSNPASRSTAIRAYCWDCMGGKENGRSGANGNVRKLVRECSVEDCTIWPVRPWQKPAETAETDPEDETGESDTDEDQE